MPKVYFHVPFEKNDLFVGREQQIETIDRKMFIEGRFSKISIFGLGGIGKTQIVLEFAYRTRKKHPDCSIFWIQSSSLDKVEQAFLEIGKLLEIPDLNNKGADVKTLVQQNLNQANWRWLLIVDNADDVDMWFEKKDGDSTKAPLIDYLPKSPNGSIAFTTRSRKVAVKLTPAKDMIEIQTPEEKEAKELLRKRLYSQSQSDSLDVYRGLLERLAYLPLAITQAAAYINENGRTISEYISLIDETEEQMIEVLSEDFEDEGRYREARNPVATTWFISFKQIKLKDPLAAEYLSSMACMERFGIPESLLPKASKPSQKKKLEALGSLSAYSFITIRAGKDQKNGPSKDEKLLDLHRLVQLATRNWLNKEGKLGISIEKTLILIEQQFPKDAYELDTHVAELYLPHAQRVLGLCSQGCNRVRMRLLYHVSCSLTGAARSSEAVQALLELLEISAIENGKEHPSSLGQRCNLAIQLCYANRWKEAEQLLFQSIETARRVLGEYHTITLRNVAVLAFVASHQEIQQTAVSLATSVASVIDVVAGESVSDLTFAECLKSEVISSIGTPLLLLLPFYPFYTIRKLSPAPCMEEQQKTIKNTYEQAGDASRKKLESDHIAILNSIRIPVIVQWLQYRDNSAAVQMEKLLEKMKAGLGPDHDLIRDTEELLRSWRI